LLEKTLERGWKASVVVGQSGDIDSLDKNLWSYKPDGFMAHGLSTDKTAKPHPIVIGPEADKKNQADVLFLVAGGDSNKVGDYIRWVDMFNGRDQSAVAHARMRFKAAKDAGHAVTYWQQSDEGRWVKQA
jgi:DNA polymerase-3 subunit chi